MKREGRNGDERNCARPIGCRLPERALRGSSILDVLFARDLAGERSLLCRGLDVEDEIEGGPG